MIETFPNDAYLENLSGLTDLVTGVYYPAKGEGLDWYVSFVKCIYRLVKNVTVVTGLRVYKVANLYCGIKRGKFFDGNTLRDFAGLDDHILTDNATNYIYLLADGTVQFNTTGFPDPATTRHIRLATIQTADGTYDDDSITDFRDAHWLSMAGPVTNLATGGVLPANLADSIADQVPGVVITIGSENSNTITATIGVQDVQGNANANRFLLHAWLSDSQYGAETANTPTTSTTWTTGTLLQEITTKKRWPAITSGSGIAALAISETGSRTWYLNVELDGRIYASSAITFS